MIASFMTLFLAALCAQEKPAPAKLTPEIPSKVEESVLLPNTTIKLIILTSQCCSDFFKKIKLKHPEIKILIYLIVGAI